jgi:hypothetical protein
MDAQRSGALTDSEIDDALSAALAVEPSTEFLARVRTRIASEPEPSRWGYPWTLAAAGAMALAFASAVAVLQMNQAMPPAEAVLAPLPSRAFEFASLSLLPGMGMVPSVRSGFSRIRRRVVSPIVRAEPEVLPEVIIDAGEAAALTRLFSRPKEGRIDLTTLAETVQVNAALTVLNPIEIAPIIVEPLGSVTAEGARQ